MKHQYTFDKYLDFLRDSMSKLSDYWCKTGKKHPYIDDIKAGLDHADPFITYKASIAASLLLEDSKIYH